MSVPLRGRPYRFIVGPGNCAANSHKHVKVCSSSKSMATTGKSRSLQPLPTLRRWGRWGIAAGVMALLGSPQSASAQESATEGTFSAQTLQPGTGPRNFLQTRGARTDGSMAWSAGFAMHYGREPFTVQSCTTAADCEAGGTILNVVEHIFTMDFLGSFTPVPWMQIGVRAPLTYVEGDGITPAGGPNLADPVNAVALGDMELEAKFRVYGDATSPLTLGLAPFIGFPTGEATAPGSYVGDNGFTTGIRGIIDAIPVQRFRVAANLGYFYRDTGRVGATELGMDFRYGAAASYEITPIFTVLADIYGSTRFMSSSGSNNLEAGGLFQFNPLNSALAFRLGGSAGILQGIGTPDFRGLFGVMYAAESSDTDSDGIHDAEDQCPEIPEDKDGYLDDDGCPDADNDEDGIPDDTDKCPDEVEDLDKFEDDDGCAESDNDKDGIPDTADRCPSEAETVNGWQDEDGCPDVPDQDGDGVADDKDQCPAEAEDTDGFDDTDGCPDPDNDSDGIPDDDDECVDEAETLNKVDDHDGCPD